MPYINGQKTLGAVITKYLNVDDVYPVGAVYTSFDGTSPAYLFGGTWERLNNTFLYATNNDNNIGNTGGEATHVLTIDEMPSHNHSISEHNDGTTQAPGVDMTWLRGAAVGETEYKGGGQAHNNMPPYVKVAIWKRVPDEEV